jgi:hypothetical protein
LLLESKNVSGAAAPLMVLKALVAAPLKLRRGRFGERKQDLHWLIAWDFTIIYWLNSNDSLNLKITVIMLGHSGMIPRIQFPSFVVTS